MSFCVAVYLAQGQLPRDVNERRNASIPEWETAFIWKGNVCSLPLWLFSSLCCSDLSKEHTKVLRSEGVPVHLTTMEPGATYCVKAQTYVKAIRKHSAFSQAQCIEVQGEGGLLGPADSPSTHTFAARGC